MVNRKQKIILWTGIAIFVVLGLAQLCNYTTTFRLRKPRYPASPLTLEQMAATKKSLDEMAEQPISFHRKRIDSKGLAIQWSLVVAVTGGLLVTFKNRKDD